MSNIHLLLSLAGFLAAIFAWFRFDINKRIDDMNTSMHKRLDDQNAALAQHFDNVNQRFNDLTAFINKRIDDLITAPKQAA